MDATRRSSYTGARSDLTALAGRVSGAILDVGCANGAVGAAILEDAPPGTTVTGIEIDDSFATEARGVLDEVLHADALAGLRTLESRGATFDVIFFGDVLEHLIDPWSAVDVGQRLLAPGGRMVASLPNVAHWDTFGHLLRGSWPHRSRGIHDDTHLRFFGRRDVRALFTRGDARITRFVRVYRLLERPHPINRFSRLVAWVWPDLFTFQFYVVSQVPAPPADGASG